MWAVLACFGALTVATGWLPSDEAYDIGVTRAAPILGFLVAVTIVAELADSAGVFDAAAAVCARIARGSTVQLFILIAGLAAVITIGMSLDTTAVLLTPVVLSLVARLELIAAPFAIVVIWLANTASLLLPVSNLTNLLALQHGHMSTTQFARHMLLPQVVSVVITVCYIGFLYRHRLRGGYRIPSVRLPADRITFWVCAVACVGFAVAVTLEVPPWMAATAAAVVVLGVFGVRERGRLHWSLLPWRLVLTTEALFIVVTAVTRHGLGGLLAEWVDHSGLRTVFVAAATSNVINNLPTYLALESVVPAGTHNGLLEVLLGTNAGPLISMWGSLATLLWAERCRARAITIRPITFTLIGLAGVPLVLLGTWAVLNV